VKEDSGGFEVLQTIAQVRNLLVRRLPRPSFEDIPALSVREAYLLHSLPEEKLVKISDIAQSRGISPSTLTGLLDRLEEKGYIARHRDTGDRRSVLIERKRHVEGMEMWKRRMEEEALKIFRTMDPKDVEHLRLGLSALAAALTEGEPVE